MAQYIDKSTLVEEIDRRKKEAESNCGGYKSYDEHRCDSCTVGFYEEFLETLNTLEVKEVDLEEKATQLSQKYFPDEENIWARPNIEAHKCKSACMEIVEWLKTQKGE